MLPRSSRLIPALASASAIALTAAGWSLRAGGQNAPPQKEPSKHAPADKTVSAAPPAAEDQSKLATLRMSHMTDDEKTGVMTGIDFTYIEDDMTVTGSKGAYNQKTRILDAEGNLVMDDPKHHATCEKAHVDNSAKKKTAFLTGHVIMLIKPQEDKDAPPKSAPVAPVAPPASDKNAKESSAPPTLSTAKDLTSPKPVPATNPPATEEKEKDTENAGSNRKRGGTITCDSVEDHYKKKFMIFRGHLVFKQTYKNDKGELIERTLTAEHGEYDAKKDKMLLFEPVEGHDSLHQEMKFKGNVLVGTKEGEESLKSEDPVKIVIHPEEDDDNDSEDETKPDAAQDKKAKQPKTKTAPAPNASGPKGPG